MFYVGIDWADTQHRVSIIDSQGVEKANFSVPHTREGLECLKEKLQDTLQNYRLYQQRKRRRRQCLQPGRETGYHLLLEKGSKRQS
ncbi:MAG: transposase [Firmicutes bacterium]|nr:transposase [Bacillota bacterium]